VIELKKLEERVEYERRPRGFQGGNHRQFQDSVAKGKGKLRIEVAR
jgi:hypothetical protein